MSEYTTKQLEDKLIEKLGATYVKAIDESDGCGGKFMVTVVAEVFRGKSLLQRHRLVNTALADELKSIHAFSQKTYTTEEWEKALGNNNQ